jgi:hypothetical protein
MEFQVLTVTPLKDQELHMFIMSFEWRPGNR